MSEEAVVVVTNIARPFRQALFGTLKGLLTVDGHALRVLYTSDPSKHLRRGSPPPSVYDPVVESYTRTVSFPLGYERVVAIPVDLLRILRELSPACVVAGGFGLDSIMTAWWCGRAKVPYVIWSGAWPGKDGGGSGRLSLTIRRWLARRAHSFIAYGTAAADYLVSIGARADHIFCAWNTVDLENIASAAHRASKTRVELTPKYRLASRNLLYVGTLVESKGLLELVSAAQTVELPHLDWALHFVGAGPLRGELERRARLGGRETNFRFHGLRSATDTAELLGVADGLVLPTKREVWGLVINEAMACGLPVIASQWAGATRDLIVDGVTGYVVDPSDTARLASLMSRVLARDPESKEVGRAGADAVRVKASLAKSAEGFLGAVRCAMGVWSNAKE